MSLALLVVAPVMLLIALAIRLDSPGSALFRCERLGMRARRLWMIKFRKMHDGAHGLGLTTDDDARFTRVGGLLARFKLDELPQLWHVLKGEMSLIGPRPESPEFAERFPLEYQRITQVKPGLVGLSQLAFASESRILDDDDPVAHYVGALLPQKVRLDEMYVREWSIWMDLRILPWSVPAVLLRAQVAVHRETGRLSLRRR